MKIARNNAIQMFQTLGTMALGHLDENTLEAVMDNFNAFRKAAEDFDKLREELGKRLYADVAEERKTAFMEIVGKYEQEKDVEKKEEYKKLMQDSYADLCPVYEKQMKVLQSLYAKEIEVEITKVDKTAFVRGVLKARKDLPALLIESAFAFIFAEPEKVEDDFSELDAILAE